MSITISKIIGAILFIAGVIFWMGFEYPDNRALLSMICLGVAILLPDRK